MLNFFKYIYRLLIFFSFNFSPQLFGVHHPSPPLLLNSISCILIIYTHPHNHKSLLYPYPHFFFGLPLQPSLQHTSHISFTNLAVSISSLLKTWWSHLYIYSPSFFYYWRHSYTTTYIILISYLIFSSHSNHPP